MKYKTVKTKGKNDCNECCFVMNCINACRLPRGYHYTRVDETKDTIK